MEYTIKSLPQTTAPAGGSNIPKQSYTIKSLPTTSLPPQSPGFFQSMARGALGTAADVGIGAVKSGVGTAAGIAKLGIGGLNILSKVPGLGFLKTPESSTFAQPTKQLEQVAQPQGTAQQVGKTAGDIAQYFIPGKAEVGATEMIGKGLEAAKLAKPAQEALKIVGKGAVTGISTAGVTAAETGDLSQAKTAGGVGAIAGSLAKMGEVFGPEVARSLVRGGFKMSPAIEAKVGPKAEQATSFIINNKILGTPATKFQKIDKINTQLENTLQASVGKDIKVDKGKLLLYVNTIPEQFKNEPAVYQSVKNDVANAVKTINQTKGDKIGLDELLSGKRSYGKDAFGKSTAQVKGAVVNSEGAYALEKVYEDVLTSAMEKSGKSIEIPKDMQSYFSGKSEVTLPEFNKVYSAAINAKKFTNIAQFKSSGGLVGKLFGLWAGRAVGQAAGFGLGGELIGAAGGEIAATAGTDLLRNLGERGAIGAGQVPISTAKIGLPFFNQPQ